MKYMYPAFSKYELFGLRLGGAGLGNLLFAYARALKLAKETGCGFVWPSWRSIKLGPYLRREKDKRFYGDLFHNNSGYIDGIRKSLLLRTKKKVRVKTASDVEKAPDNSLLVFDDFTMNFQGLLDFREEIRNDLIKNLHRKNQKALEGDFSKCVNVHIRLGDFCKANTEALKSGSNNTSLPIEWYVNLINQINEITKDTLTFNIFSDGTDEELKPVLEMANTRRVFYGTSVADIIALSRAPLMIASGSSFSLWARYLGNCSSISYTNQIKDHVLSEGGGFEIEIGNAKELDSALIKKLYS